MTTTTTRDPIRQQSLPFNRCEDLPLSINLHFRNDKPVM